MLFSPYRYLYANMWFLWAVLVCSCLIMGVKHWFNDSVLAYGILILMTWLIPVYEVQLMVWLLPFFIAGYFGGAESKPDIERLYFTGQPGCTYRYPIGMEIVNIYLQ